jgi:hypothetical protein
MRTYLISYDLARPHLRKHVIAQAIMALGESWARPLESTWYVRTEEAPETIEQRVARHLEEDDGLLVQGVRGDALLANTELRWFKKRHGGIDVAEHTNVIAFPFPAPVPMPTDEPELPFAQAV